MKVVTKGQMQTQALGESFAKTLKGGELVCLYGDLGYGKTTFTKGVLEGLGMTKRVLSPTFIIVRRYSIDKKGIENIYHVDLYRMTTEEEVKHIGLSDWIHNSKNIVIMEWSERFGNRLPKKRVDIYFEYINENEREITITQRAEVV